MLGWLRYPTGGPGGLAPWVRVRLVTVTYGGSGVLAPWFKVRLVKVTYGGSGGLLSGLGSLIRDARTPNDASNPNYLNLILISFMKFKIKLSKHTF